LTNKRSGAILIANKRSYHLFDIKEMRDYMKKYSSRISGRNPEETKKSFCQRRVMLLAGITIAFVILFLCMMKIPASAGTGFYTELKRYETCLVREGDTLSSIAEENAGRLSHVTIHEYMQCIMKLNNMKSEYITAGNYILLPDYIGLS
jgi:hypothetical protein